MNKNLSSILCIFGVLCSPFGAFAIERQSILYCFGDLHPRCYMVESGRNSSNKVAYLTRGKANLGRKLTQSGHNELMGIASLLSDRASIDPLNSACLNSLVIEEYKNDRIQRVNKKCLEDDEAKRIEDQFKKHF